MRIAIIGGTDYEEAQYEDFLYKLHEKYPDATIVTGNAVGKNIRNEDREIVRQLHSAERAAQVLLEALGQTVEIPEPDPYLASYMSGSDLQINDIINGTMRTFRLEAGQPIQHRHVTPRADIIVAVGNLDSSRARMAHDIWKKLDAWRLEELRRPFHNVAAPAKKKTVKKKRAVKKRETLAV